MIASATRRLPGLVLSSGEHQMLSVAIELSRNTTDLARYLFSMVMLHVPLHAPEVGLLHYAASDSRLSLWPTARIISDSRRSELDPSGHLAIGRKRGRPGSDATFRSAVQFGTHCRDLASSRQKSGWKFFSPLSMCSVWEYYSYFYSRAGSGAFSAGHVPSGVTTCGATVRRALHLIEYISRQQTDGHRIVTAIDIAAGHSRLSFALAVALQRAGLLLSRSERDASLRVGHDRTGHGTTTLGRIKRHSDGPVPARPPGGTAKPIASGMPQEVSRTVTPCVQVLITDCSLAVMRHAMQRPEMQALCREYAVDFARLSVTEDLLACRTVGTSSACEVGAAMTEYTRSDDGMNVSDLIRGTSVVSLWMYALDSMPFDIVREPGSWDNTPLAAGSATKASGAEEYVAVDKPRPASSVSNQAACRTSVTSGPPRDQMQEGVAPPSASIASFPAGGLTASWLGSLRSCHVRAWPEVNLSGEAPVYAAGPKSSVVSIAEGASSSSSSSSRSSSASSRGAEPRAIWTTGSTTALAWSLADQYAANAALRSEHIALDSIRANTGAGSSARKGGGSTRSSGSSGSSSSSSSPSASSASDAHSSRRHRHESSEMAGIRDTARTYFAQMLHSALNQVYAAGTDRTVPSTVRLLHTPFFWVMSQLRAMQETQQGAGTGVELVAMLGDKTFDTSQCAAWRLPSQAREAATASDCSPSKRARTDGGDVSTPIMPTGARCRPALQDVADAPVLPHFDVHFQGNPGCFSVGVDVGLIEAAVDRILLPTRRPAGPSKSSGLECSGYVRHLVPRSGAFHCSIVGFARHDAASHRGSELAQAVESACIDAETCVDMWSILGRQPADRLSRCISLQTWAVLLERAPADWCSLFGNLEPSSCGWGIARSIQRHLARSGGLAIQGIGGPVQSISAGTKMAYKGLVGTIIERIRQAAAMHLSWPLGAGDDALIRQLSCCTDDGDGTARPTTPAAHRRIGIRSRLAKRGSSLSIPASPGAISSMGRRGKAKMALEVVEDPDGKESKQLLRDGNAMFQGGSPELTLQRFAALIYGSA